VRVALGLDIGTTSTKGVVLDPQGGVRESLSRPVVPYSRAAGWFEEDPEQWWRNVCEICSEVASRYEVASVGVCGMVPCVILLDHDGMPLMYSIQQNDARAGAEIGVLRTRLDEDDILRRTGSGITQQSVGPTLMWIASHEPELWARARHLCGSYDFIVYRLTGHHSIESNWALESGLYDFRTKDWALDVLQACGCDAGLLARVHEASSVVGQVSGAGSEATGLKAGIPVTAGVADHVSAALASGVVRDGDLLVKLGGAGDILMCSKEPVVDGRLYLDYHVVPGLWLPNGCMATSGTLVRWFQTQLAGGMPLADLDAEAAESTPGARAVTCLPYFLGEKTPIHDPDARGAFTGLHLGTTRGDLFRAVLESVGYAFRHHLEVLAEHGLTPERIRIADGGSKSRLWVQIIAGILEAQVETLEVPDASAVGAAFVGGLAAGAFSGWGEIERFVTVRTRVDPEDQRQYSEGYARYRALYPALRGACE
jgi:xylulokinase